MTDEKRGKRDMMPIRKIEIENFRGIKQQTLEFQGKSLNAIVGQNGSMKTTLLGIIAASFSLKSSALALEKAIGGDIFGIELDSRVRFSERFDEPKSHRWSMYLSRNLSEEPIRMSSYRRPGRTFKLRFWRVGKRIKGDTLPQVPVLYLSLKRLSPIAEEKGIMVDKLELSDEEKNLFTEWHSRILVSQDTIDSIDHLSSKAKNTLAPTTNYYDSLAISSGQDNVGKIILAVISMKRLKEKYPSEYRGSIVCVDEIENTLYPAAQGHLLEFLKKMSKEYDIQFFFSTHSLTIVNLLTSPEYEKFSSVNYAHKGKKDVIIEQNVSRDNIINELYLGLADKMKSIGVNRIKVYCEDDVGMNCCKYLLGRKYSQQQLDYQNRNGFNLSNTQILQLLVDNKFVELQHGIIVLDGDTRKHPDLMKKVVRMRNVVLLPTDYAPEEMVFRVLRESNDCWDEQFGGNTKQKCFEGLENITLEDPGEYTKEKGRIKDWFRRQKGQRGRGYNAMLKIAYSSYAQQCEQFIKDFASAFEYTSSKNVL